MRLCHLSQRRVGVLGIGRLIVLLGFIKLCVRIGEPRCTSSLPHASLNFCTPHLTLELAMLGSKGFEKIPLVSSCEISTENRIELFQKRFPKKDDYKNYIVLIEKVPHDMGINNVYSQKHNV